MKVIKKYTGLYLTDYGTYKIRLAVPPLAQKMYKMGKEINISLKTKDFEQAKTKYYEIMPQIIRKFNMNGKIESPQDRPFFPQNIFEEKLLKSVFHFFSEYSGKIQAKQLQEMVSKDNISHPSAIQMAHYMQLIRNFDQEKITTFQAELKAQITSETTNLMITYLINSQYNLTDQQRIIAQRAFAQTIIEAANFHIATEIDYSYTPETYPFKFEITQKAYRQYATNHTLSSQLIMPQKNANNDEDDESQNILSKIKNTNNKNLSISELLTKWKDDCGDAIKEKVPHIQSFIACFPEKEKLDEIQSSDIVQWIEILKITPKHFHRIKEFKNLGIEDILSQNEKLKYPCLTNKTINTYINSFSTFHKWAKKKGVVCSDNPTKDTLFNKKDLSSPIPLTYTHQEMQQIISYLTKHKQEKIDLYWAFMIAIYTGMREGEFCQLRTKDIRTRDNIQYFSINNEEDKTIKNQNSIRMIPIHKKLIELGINDFIKEREKTDNSNLFPSFKVYTRGTRKTFNKCFSQPIANILKELGLKKQGRLVHALRHTCVDELRLSGLSDDEIQFLVGHKKQTMTNYYGRRQSSTPLTLFQEWINKIDYSTNDKNGN